MMFGNTAKAEQFYGRTANESTKGSRKGYSLLGGGENPTSVLTQDQKIFNERSHLVAKKAEFEARLHALNLEVRREAQFKKPRFHQALQERDKCKAEITSVCERLTAIKLERTRFAVPGRLEKHFMDICRETMTKAQFRIFLDQARERAAEDAG